MSLSSKIHKILGTLLSALMAVWFFSGLVMVYHRFPRVTSNETIRKKDNIDLRHLPDINIITEELPGNASIKSLYVRCCVSWGKLSFMSKLMQGHLIFPQIHYSRYLK